MTCSSARDDIAGAGRPRPHARKSSHCKKIDAPGTRGPLLAASDPRSRGARPTFSWVTTMRSAVRAAALSLALPLLLSSVLTAQQHRPGIVDVSGRSRHGFWGSFGIGAGAEAVDLVNPDDGLGYSNNLTKPTVQLRLGGTVNPHLRLGGELSSWVNSYYGDSGDVT